MTGKAATAWDLSRRDVLDRLPVDRNRLFPDGKQDGLYLRVQNGVKSWVVRYRAGPVQRQKSLPLSQPYAQARDLARELRLAARRGTDLVADARAEMDAKRQKELSERTRDRRLLGKVIEGYMAGPVLRLAPRTQVEVRRYLSQAWRSLHEHDPDQLDRRTVVVELERIARERGPIAGNRAKAYLSSCLAYAVERGLLERNVLKDIKRLEPEVKRQRVLDRAELQAVWEASDPATDYGCILQLLMLTGQRREEVGGFRWSELDLQRAMWQLPAYRTKNGLPHAVPLSRQAMALISPRKRVEGRDLVFGTGQSSFSGWTKAKRRLDSQLKLMEPWVVHDLRRSFCTHCAELGIAPHIIEAVVNHISGHKGGVAGIYNRAQYAQEKRAALQRWADHVESIMAGEPDGDNVVTFAR